jgi:Fur family ferric uptake transcriptional regulator
VASEQVAAKPAAEELILRLRAEGRRITAARRNLADALAEAETLVSAEELIARLQVNHPDLAPSTVYRLLVDLESLGLVSHVHLGHGPAYYCLADARHVHLVCDACGVATELSPEVVDVMVATLRSAFGFQAGFHHFSIDGLCQKCLDAGAVRASPTAVGPR